MRTRILRFLAAIIFLASVSWSFQAGASFSAGAAAADITPDLETMKVPSAGYGARGKTPMDGVHDPVFCKALVVSDGEEIASLVTCDLVGISPLLRQKILDGLEGTGIDDHNLMMTASHTHSGPGAMQKNFIAGLVFGRYNEKLTQQTADRVVAAIKQAREEAKPAAMKVARTTVEGVNRNRRDPAGSYNYDTRRFSSAYDPDNPQNLIDPLLTVIDIRAKDGSPIAVVFSFAAHGTVLGADNMLISADWPGAAQKKIEEAIPGAVAMFVNGAIGDQAPAMDEDEISDFEYVEIIGSKVAGAVISAIDKAKAASPTPVTSVLERRRMPPGKQIMGVRLPGGLIKAFFTDMPLQALRIGDVVFMGTPLEMVAEIGWAMRNGAEGQGVPYPIVAGVANNTLLYCATPDDFKRGGYEVGNTVWGEIEAGIVIGEQMLLVRKVWRD